MSPYSVKVSNIAPTTTEVHLSDFFTFCGKIDSIDFKADEKSATVHFEKPSAAKTALMLNGGTLDGSQLSVTSDDMHPDEDDTPHPDGAPYHQSDKPRAGIAAEYLARGYKLSDNILQRAIEIDNKQGISKRFLAYIHSLNTQVSPTVQSLDSQLGSKVAGPDRKFSTHVQDTLKNVDEQRGISKAANDYYSKAISSPFGQKVLSFYSSTSKQILDIHEEARRIASQSTENKETAPAPPLDEKHPIQTTTNAPGMASATAPPSGPSTNNPTSAAPVDV